MGRDRRPVRPQTRKTYIANARRAITLFLEWVDNRFDWRALGGGHKTTQRQPPTDQLYRFPLRKHVIVTLRLPNNLAPAEAARLTAFITAPAVPDDARRRVVAAARRRDRRLTRQTAATHRRDTEAQQG
jgi:hypothetical protein